jgi:hypothetical protein
MSRWLAVFALGFFLCTAFRAGWNNLSTDFPNYYTAAVATRKGFSLRLLYDWTWFRRQMVYAGVEKQLGAYTPQTPLTILPMLALTGLSPQSAKRVWLICDLGFLATTILLLASVSGLRIDTVLLLAFCGYLTK